MANKDIRIEALADLFQKFGVIATPEQIDRIANGFAEHIEMESESASYQHVGTSKCSKCEKLELDLREVTRKISVFEQSAKERLKASEVYIKDGSVMYDK